MFNAIHLKEYMDAKPFRPFRVHLSRNYAVETQVVAPWIFG